MAVRTKKKSPKDAAQAMVERLGYGANASDDETETETDPEEERDADADETPGDADADSGDEGGEGDEGSDDAGNDDAGDEGDQDAAAAAQPKAGVKPKKKAADGRDAASERSRILAIMNSKVGAAHPKAAMILIEKTDLSATDAVALLNDLHGKAQATGMKERLGGLKTQPLGGAGARAADESVVDLNKIRAEVKERTSTSKSLARGY